MMIIADILLTAGSLSVRQLILSLVQNFLKFITTIQNNLNSDYDIISKKIEFPLGAYHF